MAEKFILLTDQDVAHFESEVRRFMKFFHMEDWCVYFVPVEDEPDYLAQCNSHPYSRTVVFNINRKWGTSVADEHTSERITKLAFHEVWELLLSDLRQICLDTDMGIPTRNDLANKEAHSLIRRMENLILPLIPNDDNSKKCGGSCQCSKPQPL